MLQGIGTPGEQIIIFDKKIGIFVVTQKTDVACQTDQQQKFFLRLLVSFHSGHSTSDNIIAYNASQKEDKEIRTSLSIKIEGADDQPYFSDGVKFKPVQNKIDEKGNRQKQKNKFIC